MRIIQRRLKQTEVVIWLVMAGVLLGSTSVVATEWMTNRTSETELANEENNARSRLGAVIEAPAAPKEESTTTTTAPSTTATTVPLTAAAEVVAPVEPEPAAPADVPATTAAPRQIPPTTPAPTQPPTTPAPTEPPTTPAPTEPPTTPAPTEPPTTPAPTEPPTTQPPQTQPPTSPPPTEPPTTPPPTTQPPETQPPVTNPPDDDDDDDDDEAEDDDDDDEDQDDFAAARITSFTLINAKSDVDLFGLSDGSTVSLDDTGNRLSIRANVNRDVGSVVWSIDGRAFKVENNNPYALAGNNGNNYGAVRIRPGTYTFTAQMFSERKGRGDAGHAVSMTITFN